LMMNRFQFVTMLLGSASAARSDTVGSGGAVGLIFGAKRKTASSIAAAMEHPATTHPMKIAMYFTSPPFA
jgi:hypothetical protein